MFLIPLLILAASAAVTVWMLVLTFRILRAAAKRRLLAQTRGTLCDAPDGVGISALCSYGGDAAQITDLLNVGYACYEAVVVIDAERYPEAFEALAARYHLIRVNHTLADELPTEGVRGLYRSRKRCFRRLVAVDKTFTTVAADLDAAAGVATYDYVFPLAAHCRLVPYAVGRLAAELSGRVPGETVMVRAAVGMPAMLLSREAVIAAGGFRGKPWRHVPRRSRVTLYEPLLQPVRRPRYAGPKWRRAWAVLLAAAIGGVAVAGWWTICVVLLTMAVVWCCSQLAMLSGAQDGASLDGCGPLVGLRPGRFNVKNFTVS